MRFVVLLVIGFFFPITGVGSQCLAQERIVSLAPSLTAIVCELERCDQLVGVTEYCLWPPQVQNLPRVGSYMEPNLEVIVALKPDLVLGLPEHQATTEKLKSLNIRVASIRNYSLEDIYRSFSQMGELLDRVPQSLTWIRKTRQRQQELTRTPTSRPRCLLVLGHEAGRDAIREVYVVGRKGFLNELLTLAGGENAWPEETNHFPKVNQEVLLSLDPDIIIELVPLEQLSQSQTDEIQAAWQAVPHLKAVANHRLHILNNTHILQSGPRFLDTLSALTRILELP